MKNIQPPTDPGGQGATGPASETPAEQQYRRELHFLEQHARALGIQHLALGATIDLLRACPDLKTLGERAAAALQSRFGFVYGAFWMAADGPPRLCAEHGFINDDFAAAARGGCELVVRALHSGHPEIVPQVGDLAECPRAAVARRAAVASCLVIPIKGEGGSVGALEFYSMDTLVATPEHLSTFGQIGHLLSLEEVRFEQSQRAMRHLRATQEERDLLGRIVDVVIAAEQGAATEPSEGLMPVLQALTEHFSSPYASYWVIERREHEVPAMRYRLHAGIKDQEMERIHQTQICVEGQGLIGRTWRAGALLVVDEVGRLFDCPRVGVARRLGLHGALCFPVCVRGEVRATVDIFSFGRFHISPEMRGFLSRIGLLLGTSRLAPG